MQLGRANAWAEVWSGQNAARSGQWLCQCLGWSSIGPERSPIRPVWQGPEWNSICWKIGVRLRPAGKETRFVSSNLRSPRPGIELDLRRSGTVLRALFYQMLLRREVVGTKVKSMAQLHRHAQHKAAGRRRIRWRSGLRGPPRALGFLGSGCSLLSLRVLHLWLCPWIGQSTYVWHVMVVLGSDRCSGHGSRYWRFYIMRFEL